MGHLPSCIWATGSLTYSISHFICAPALWSYYPLRGDAVGPLVMNSLWCVPNVAACRRLTYHSWTTTCGIGIHTLASFLRTKCCLNICLAEVAGPEHISPKPSNTNRHTQCARSECWRIYHISISPSLCHHNPHSCCWHAVPCSTPGALACVCVSERVCEIFFIFPTVIISLC